MHAPPSLEMPAAEIGGEERAGPLAIGRGEQVERECHRLPGEQEDEALVGADQRGDREQDQRVQAGDGPRGRAIEQGERDRRSGRAGECQEDAGEPVGDERCRAEPEPGTEPDARGRPVGGGGEADHREQGRACGGGCEGRPGP